MMLERVGAMIVGHMVGDYIAQNDWMAKNKTGSTIVAATHALVWTLCVYVGGGLWQMSPEKGVVATLWLFLTHFVIDRWRLAPRSMEYTGQRDFAGGLLSPWSKIIVDNSWHLVTIWAVAVYW